MLIPFLKILFNLLSIFFRSDFLRSFLRKLNSIFRFITFSYRRSIFFNLVVWSFVFLLLYYKYYYSSPSFILPQIEDIIAAVNSFSSPVIPQVTPVVPEVIIPEPEPSSTIADYLPSYTTVIITTAVVVTLWFCGVPWDLHLCNLNSN